MEKNALSRFGFPVGPQGDVIVRTSLKDSTTSYAFLVGWSVISQSLQILGQEKKTFTYALVSLASFLYPHLLHEILKFLVSTQAQDFLATTGRISGLQRGLNDEEERLEFVGFRAG